jgi:tetratricopeptide (TPR) repeat protein
MMSAAQNPIFTTFKIQMTRMITHRIGLLALGMVLSAGLQAQSVPDARKLIYYERYQSARDMLQKVVAASPADAEAVYWLAQAEFGLFNPAGAKAVLQKGLEGANAAHPLLLAGMGQAELSEGKKDDARQRFETALNLSKGKDIGVITAIGRANLEKDGDAAYAIEKLKLATAIYDAQKKGSKDPNVYIVLGDAYRKLMDGGNAVTAYENALLADPKHAAAKYKIAKVYLTQGVEQRDIFVRNFEEATTLDPAYAPAYYDLYVFYFSRDVYKSTTYFNQYKANTDIGPALDYEEASLLYASSDFDKAIEKATQLLAAQGDKADARLYRLQAYSYDKKKDSVKTVELLEKFFSLARPDQVLSDNYVVMAVNCAKFPTRQAQVDEYFGKAVESDTALKNKIDYTRKAANFFKGVKNQPKSAEWFSRVLSVNPSPSKADLYNAGFENFRAGEFQRSDSIFKLYSAKFPEEVYGYYWSFRALSVIDSTMEKGLAIADCQKFIEIADKDRVRNKNTLITALGYMAGYTANIGKDYTGAVAFLDKLLEIDPANADAAKNKEILLKAATRAQSPGGKPAGENPPKAGGGRP